MKRTLQLEAIKLRQQGWAYSDIVQRLGVSKSTVSLWTRDVPYTPNKVVLKRVNDSLIKTVMARHAIKIASLQLATSIAKQELGQLSDRDLLMIGLGLFIGEGSKREELLHIANSDPEVLRLAIKWLQKSFKIPLKHFQITVHIYPDNSEIVAKRYWAKITGVPLSQFGRTQIDRRTNKLSTNRRKLPYGTAHIKVRACGNPEFGVLLHRRIMALVSETYSQMRV